MPNNRLPRSSGAAAAKTLSPEEKADLGVGALARLSETRLFSFIWRLKLRLQFTGWLQYIPFGLGSLALFLLAALVRLLGGRTAAIIIACAGTLPLAVFLSDLVTVKFRLHPPEKLPKRKEGLDIFELMRVRHSCRAFQTRKLTPADRQALMESVRVHSQASHIGTAPIRFEYISAPLTVWPVVNASEFLVAIAPKDYNRLAIIDVGRSLQMVVMDATHLGLATCWIGPGADHESIIRDLGQRFDPQADHIICVCAVGYQSRYIPMFIRIFNRQFRQRLPLSALFFADANFTLPLDQTAPPYNRFGRCYEVCQWAPSSYNGQTTRCVAVTAEVGGRLERVDFYASTVSRYYAPVAVGIWCANWELGCEALGIHGHFAVLSARERNLQDEALSRLPRYDLSWIVDQKL